MKRLISLAVAAVLMLSAAFAAAEGVTFSTPYFTMELDMSNFRICQLYGFSDCSAPPEIRKFAERFALYASRAKMVAAS